MNSIRGWRRAWAIATAQLATLAAGCLSMDRPSVAFWAAGEDRTIGSRAQPDPESAVFSARERRVRLLAAANETLGFQLAIAAPALSGPYDVQVTDLSGAGGLLLAEPNVRLFRVAPVRIENFASWYPAHTGRAAAPISVADVLVPWDAPRGGGPIAPGGDGNQLIWVDLHVPADTAAGDYTGSIDILSGASESLVESFTLELEVLPVEIPAQRSLPIVARLDPRGLLRAHLDWPEGPAADVRFLPDVPEHEAGYALVASAMRMLHEHRLNPVLWAAFPKFEAADPRTVAVEWEDYDRLVTPWLDGSAFADGVPLAYWPVPCDLEYPSAERNGGVRSARYTRLLAGYLAASSAHFAERGWLERGFVRIAPPAALSDDAIERVERLVGALRQSESPFPMVAHLPASPLSALGWHDAPPRGAPRAAILAPPASWYEPEAMGAVRGEDRQSWFMPDRPPFSAALTPESPAGDAGVLAWQAFRYGAQGIWIEHAGPPVNAVAAEMVRAGSAALLYPGTEFGLSEPVPSLRLKRLRRGQTDYELLAALERAGKPLLARRAAERIVARAFTDAATDNLQTVRWGGWSSDAPTIELARALVLRELAGTSTASRPADSPGAVPAVADWGRLMARSVEPIARSVGARLAFVDEKLNAGVAVEVLNPLASRIDGAWTLAEESSDWAIASDAALGVGGGARAAALLTLEAPGLAYSADGVLDVGLAFDAGASGGVDVPTRIAVTSCVPVDQPPNIDGDESDWAVATNNSAADFRLVRGSGPLETPGVPAGATRAYFWFDVDHLYVGIAAALPVGARPHYRADNDIPIDGSIPWGQDVIELILDPQSSQQTTHGDLLVLQIKPNGFTAARRGPRTEPPIGASAPWLVDARVASSVKREAWVVEIALPIDALGEAARRDRIWGVNVARLDAARGEYSSWSGARDHCYSPQTLGNLVILRP